MMRKFDRSLIPAVPDFQFEQALWSQGISTIGGIDEAGRGAWAGPVSAGVVVLSPAAVPAEALARVRDSKQLSAAVRETCAHLIMECAAAWGVGMASSDEIDRLGILPATRLAVERALDQLNLPPQHLLVDYLPLVNVPLPQTQLVKGDARSLSIACASILAKTSRDAVLRSLDSVYPGYGFARHKGYGARAHQAALSQMGPCPVHRFSFAPIRNWTAASQ